VFVDVGGGDFFEHLTQTSVTLAISGGAFFLTASNS
jgi:hypothetical protein